MIRTVIFDLGKVIVPFDLQRGYDAIAGVCPHPAAEVAERIRASGLVRRFESGEVESGEFIRALSRMLDLNVSRERFREVWSSIFLPETLIPESLVEALRRRYRVLLLSNTNALHFEMIRETYPIMRHFDGYVLSFEVGAMKPAPKIYAEAIARAGCRPAEIFYTDDIPAFVEAARLAGIDAVAFESLPQIEGEMRARGIEW